MPVHGAKRVNMLSHFGNASSLNFNTVTSELPSTCPVAQTRSECEMNRRTQLIDLLNIVIIAAHCRQVPLLPLSTWAALHQTAKLQCTVCLCTPYWLHFSMLNPVLSRSSLADFTMRKCCLSNWSVAPLLVIINWLNWHLTNSIG